MGLRREAADKRLALKPLKDAMDKAERDVAKLHGEGRDVGRGGDGGAVVERKAHPLLQRLRLLTPLPEGTSLIAPATNTDWSNSGVMFMSFGAAARIPGISDFTVLTTDSVEALPFFNIVSSTPRTPFWRTIFCCGGPPSRT